MNLSLKKIAIGLIVAAALFSALLVLVQNSYARSISSDDINFIYCTLTRTCPGSNIGATSPIPAIFNISDHVTSVLSAEKIRDDILKHKTTGVTYVADHLEPTTGKLYRHKVTGEYFSEGLLEEVPYDGLMHKYTGEVFVADHFLGSIDHIYRHRAIDGIIHLSEHDYQNALESAIDMLEGKVIEVLSQ